jgi:spore cortex formation protein SpoVR/YcgB (stage V sporulation)
MNSRFKHDPLPCPSDWTFELIERYNEEIARVAKGYGLDTYPNQLEIITAEQMMDAYASHGMPVNYRHWSYGKHFMLTERATSAARWAWPTRSSSTPTPASPT